MAHEITIREDGFAEAAFARDAAWHGLGQIVAGAMSSKEALEQAGLDWEVAPRPLWYGEPKTIQTPEGPVDTYDYHEVEGNVANVRADTGLVMGIVSDKYQIVQNAEAFDFLDSLLENHELEYESAFSLRGGRNVVITALLPGVDEIVDGDAMLRYILLGMAHDGTAAINFGLTSTRVVCANTYRFALDSDGKTIKELSIRHAGKISDRLERAREIIGVANAGFDSYTDVCRKLADCQLSRDDFGAYLDVMCPVPAKLDPDWTATREKRILETRDAIKRLYDEAEGCQLDGVRGTAWAAFNAITEHVDHLPRRGATPERRAEARFNVTLYGAGRDQKDRAFKAACRLAAIEPSICV